MIDTGLHGSLVVTCCKILVMLTVHLMIFVVVVIIIVTIIIIICVCNLALESQCNWSMMSFPMGFTWWIKNRWDQWRVSVPGVSALKLLVRHSACTKPDPVITAEGLFLMPSVWVFLFVHKISLKPLNRFAPNSHGRHVWSLAQTSLKVKVTRTKNGIFRHFRMRAVYVWWTIFSF